MKLSWTCLIFLVSMTLTACSGPASGIPDASVTDAADAADAADGPPPDAAGDGPIQCGGQDEPCCSPFGCTGFLDCNLDNICTLCGEEGQPCCANGICRFSRECTVEKKCGACGATGEPCCIDGSCDGNRTCNTSGICQP